MGAHKQSWVHGPNEGVQQGRIELRGGRDSRTNCGHLADYVDCPNDHLRRTFLHPDVQARGCTRIELSVRLPRGRPLGEHSQRGGGGGLGPGFPLRSARPVCSPTARQAVGEPGRMSRPVHRPSRPAPGLDIRSLVCAHDNRPGVGSLGPANQGTRRKRGNMGEGRRMSRGRLRVPRMPNLPGRHSGSQ